MTVFDFTIWGLFVAGMDTAEIADALRQKDPIQYQALTEAKVYNALARVREAERRAA